MRAVRAAVLCVILPGCTMLGTEAHYGVSEHSMAFGELNMVLADDEGSSIQGVPFLLAGQGILPPQYGDDVSYQRVSLGQKVRYPLRLAEGRVLIYLEAGGMVSYYESDAIGTPFEPEVVAGGGVQLNLGKKWSANLGARARTPVGNGSRHEAPEHAPDGTQPEFYFGVRKDF
jgi:hypothetical protein